MMYKKSLSVLLITSICLSSFGTNGLAKGEKNDIQVQKEDSNKINTIAYSVLADKNVDNLLNKDNKEYVYFISYDKVTNDKNYIVQKGDTLKTVSEQFNLNLTELLDLNLDLAVSVDKQDSWIKEHPEGVIDSTSNIGIYEGLEIKLGTVKERTSIEITLKDKESIDDKIKSLGLENSFIESKISKKAYEEMTAQYSGTIVSSAKKKKEDKKAIKESKKLLEELKANPEASINPDAILASASLNADLVSDELKAQLEKNNKKQRKLKKELDKALKDSLAVIEEQQALQKQRESQAQSEIIDNTIIDSSTDTTESVTGDGFASQLVTAGLNESLANSYTKSLDYAYTLLGVPYVFGGTSENGIDCSGYVYRAYNAGGIPIHRTTALGYYNMSTLIDNPVPGDLVFFVNTYKAGISHIGIYIGDNKMINAVGDYVQITDMTSNYWSSRFAGYGRLNQLMN